MGNQKNIEPVVKEGEKKGPLTGFFTHGGKHYGNKCPTKIQNAPPPKNPLPNQQNAFQ